MSIQGEGHRRTGVRRNRLWLFTVTAVVVLAATASPAQTLPATQGETLSGKKIVPAEAVRGHASVLVAGFSREAGDGAGAWAKAIRADPAMQGVAMVQIAMLEKAPAFVRGMIKSGMRKGLSGPEQESFVVLTQDDGPWRSYFQVADDKEPYVVAIDASGKIVWHGHGSAKDLEPQLRAAYSSR